MTHLDLVELPLIEHLEQGEPRGGLKEHQHLRPQPVHRLTQLKQQIHSPNLHRTNAHGTKSDRGTRAPTESRCWGGRNRRTWGRCGGGLRKATRGFRLRRPRDESGWGKGSRRKGFSSARALGLEQYIREDKGARWPIWPLAERDRAAGPLDGLSGVLGYRGLVLLAGSEPKKEEILRDCSS